METDNGISRKGCPSPTVFGTPFGDSFTNIPALWLPYVWLPLELLEDSSLESGTVTGITSEWIAESELARLHGYSVGGDKKGLVKSSPV